MTNCGGGISICAEAIGFTKQLLIRFGCCQYQVEPAFRLESARKFEFNFVFPLFPIRHMHNKMAMRHRSILGKSRIGTFHRPIHPNFSPPLKASLYTTSVRRTASRGLKISGVTPL